MFRSFIWPRIDVNVMPRSKNFVRKVLRYRRSAAGGLLENHIRLGDIALGKPAK